VREGIVPPHNPLLSKEGRRGGCSLYETTRQDFIESFGISFLRFTNREVYENLGEVLAKIENCIQEKSTIEHLRKG
jgi:hypothetical protein